MGGLARLLIFGTAGAAIACWLPRNGVVAATQEMIAFLALLMAGLLPAMILTATILKGSGLSVKRIDEYGGALRAQMRFWGVLFGAAGIATLGVVGTKIFSAPGVAFEFQLHVINLNAANVTGFFVGLSGFGIGAVFQRLLPAYRGLKSLLDLNVQLARVEALANDRSLLDALERDVSGHGTPEAYRLIGTGR